MTESDIVQITNVINLYALAVDTHRWDLFDDVFTADIAIDFGGPAAWQNRDALKAAFAAIHEPFRSTQHFTSNHQIRIVGDDATATSYVRGMFMRNMPAGGDLFESTGWYDDALIRTPHGWRIQRRSSRMTWWGGNPKVLETAPGAGAPAVFASLSQEAADGAIAHLAHLLQG